MINRELNIGDQVWYARYNFKRVTKECPICFGKLKVKIILGDDSEVEVPCDYCGNGYLGPQGVIEEHQTTAEPVLVKIDEIEEKTDIFGKKVRKYSQRHNQSGYYEFDNLDDRAFEFDDKESAIAKSLELKKEDDIDKIKSKRSAMKRSVEKLTWNAGYWQRQIKNLEADIERYSRYITICKEKSKGK